MMLLKNNKIILRGIRNPKDSLCDIPIQKTNITANCCIAPSPLGPLQQQQPVQKVQRAMKRLNITSNALPLHLQSLGNLEIDNDFNNSIDDHEEQVEKNKTQMIQLYPREFKTVCI